MNRNALWQLAWFLPLLLAVSLLFGWIDDWAMRIDVSEAGGMDPFFGTFLSTFADISLGLASVFGILIGLLLCGFRRAHLPALFLLLGGLTYLGSCQARPLLFGSPRDDAFLALGERLMPVVDGIDAFHADRGGYPQSLDDLVPDYLPALQPTGMANYPEYTYLVGKNAARHRGNPWIIEVFAGYGMGFDQFYYYPLQNYPEGGSFERLGKWAYFHE